MKTAQSAKYLLGFLAASFVAQWAASTIASDTARYAVVGTAMSAAIVSLYLDVRGRA